MWNLVVLGLIPGTHIQINFMVWLVILSAGALFLITTVAAIRKLRQHTRLTTSTTS